MPPQLLRVRLLIVSITLAHSAQSVRISPAAELCCAAALKDLNDAAFPLVSKWFVYGIQRAIPRKEKKTKRNETKLLLACQLSPVASLPFRPRAVSPATFPLRTYVNP